MPATVTTTTTTTTTTAHSPEQLKHLVHASSSSAPPTLDMCSKDEEAASGYNAGGYMVVRVGDAFKEGRYVVLRKLGCVSAPCVIVDFLC
jgi:hypothetical protein